MFGVSLNFWGDLDLHADSPNRKPGQYGRNAGNFTAKKPVSTR